MAEELVVAFAADVAAAVVLMPVHLRRGRLAVGGVLAKVVYQLTNHVEVAAVLLGLVLVAVVAVALLSYLPFLSGARCLVLIICS